MDKYNILCKKHKIVTLTPQEFDKLGFEVPPQTREQEDGPQPSTALQLNIGPFKKHYILTPDNAPQIHKWHELGHILHPAGGMQYLEWDNSRFGTLINELAASYWAMVHNDLPRSTQSCNLELLQHALSTYTDHGFDTCPDNDIFRIYARKLKVEDKLKWRRFKTKARLRTRKL